MDLSLIAAIDQHAYPLLTQENAALLPFAAAFMNRLSAEHIQQNDWPTLSYLRSRREIAAFLECDPTEDAIQVSRTAIDLKTLTQRYLDAANLEVLFLDDGLFPNSSLPLDWHQTLIPTYRLINIEALAERLMADVDRFDVFLEWFRSEIDVSDPYVVGLISTAAHRSGLAIEWVYPDVAEACFEAIKQRSKSLEQPIRLVEKELINFLVIDALNRAVTEGIPVQFDLGMGPASVQTSLSNPMQLRSLFEEATYQSVPIVLSGGASVFSHEAAALASMYPQVYVDIGSITTAFSIRGIKRQIHTFVDQVPLSKILYASGTRFFPELFYLGAKQVREALGHLLDDAINDGDLSAVEAEEGAISILRGTAEQLYLKT
ncbi:MAG: amidohydrolase [Cyanobacteria bacterium J06627_8]